MTPTAIQFGFRLPNLPKERYEYLKQIRVTTGLSPWQVIVLALNALEYLGSHDGPTALRLVEDVKTRYPKP